MSEQELDRRSFARRLAGTALTTAVTASLATTAAPRAAADDKPQAPAADVNAPDDVNAPAEPKAPQALVDQPPTELLLALVRQKYPHPLTAEQADAIRSQLAWYWQRSAVLSSFPLTNADEPAPIFAAYRGQSE